jgi:hypothetical protein
MKEHFGYRAGMFNPSEPADTLKDKGIGLVSSKIGLLGTGYYFMGNKEDAIALKNKLKYKTLSEINLSKYKLYKPSDATEFYNNLRDVTFYLNSLTAEDVETPEVKENIEDAIEAFSEYFNMSKKTVSDIFQEYISDIINKKDGNLLSNRLLSKYDGIDLTHTIYDDFGAGSLIFNGKLKQGTYEVIEGESNETLSEAKQVGIIYHYTLFDYMQNIVHENLLRSENINNKDKIISFTRDKNFNKKHRKVMGTECRLVIDGNKLSEKYRINPVADAGFSRYGGSTESEERIVNDIGVKDIDKYIIYYDLFLNKIKDKYDKKILDNLIGELKSKGLESKIRYFYNDKEITPDHAEELLAKRVKSIKEVKDIDVISEIQALDDTKKIDNLKKMLTALSRLMINKGMNIEPLPKIITINHDEENANNLLGRTGHYDPDKKEITIFTMGRHIIDCTKTFCHEMIHHEQNLEGRLDDVDTEDVNQSDYLKLIEEEAYLRSQIIYREWVDTLREAEKNYSYEQ